MTKTAPFAILVIYLVMLVAGFMSDVFLPAFAKEGNVYSFHGSYTIGFTLANIALLLGAVLLLILLVSLNQVQSGSLNLSLIIRRVLVTLMLVVLLGGALAGSVYVFSKRIIVGPDKIDYYSLVETKEVRWIDVKQIKGNFVSGSRLGFDEGGDYAWVDFVTRDGQTVHLSLRFLQGVSQLETVIEQLSRK